MKMGVQRGEKVKLLDDPSVDYGSVIETKEKKTKKGKEETANIFYLFRYTTKLDRILLITGTIFSLISGSCLPILGFFFGGMTNIFLNQATQGLISDEAINATLRNAAMNANPVAINFDEHFVPVSLENQTIIYEVIYVLHEVFRAELPQKDLWKTDADGNKKMTVREFNNTLNKYLIIYLIIGTIMMICSFIQTFSWEYVSEHLVLSMRKLYFSQIMRQDISWYDTNDNGNLPNKLSDDLERIRDGTGYKCVMIIQYLTTFFSGIGVGLYVNLPLTLVTLCVGPFLIALTAYSAKFAALSAAREQEKYSAAGAIAEETLSNIKTVHAFCGFSVSIKKYDEELEAGRKVAMSRYNVFSVCIAITFALMYAAYGLGFWYGSKLVQDGIATPGSVFTVFFSVVVGAFSIGNALPYFNIVSSAVGVMSGIKQIMSRQVTIDPYADEGRKLKQVIGDIEFKNVSFSYPSRSNIQVLKQLNLKIESGSTVAVVGSSGAGKSTIVGLILRFYDPQHGSICIDDNPINELNVNWWRKQIGLVSQEPILFGVSIADNIRYGRENVTTWEVIEAAKSANAHEFIMKLPNSYETLVGDTGSQLSGGQKQRIAIARALVRNPKILLLDEATSALDAHSEGIVQEALEKAMRGRTTIIVAHRLSTIRNADSIHVMKDGAVVESGTHDELMGKQSLYYNLVTAQTKSDASDNVETTSADETNDESYSSHDEMGESSDKFDDEEILKQQKDTSGISPKQLLEELKNDKEKYAIKLASDETEDDDQNKHSEGHDHQESYKVLDRDVSTETLSDDNDDDEYETVVTHVRETREILFEDDEDEIEESESQPEISKETEEPEEDSTRFPEKPEYSPEESKFRRRKRPSVSEEKKSIPFNQPEEIEKDISVWELLKLHKPEWQWLLLGFIGCACAGSIMPIFALYYGQIFTVFTKTGIELIEATKFWTFMFLLLSIFTAISFYCQAKGATTANEKLIARMRLLVFENILRQPVGWFDLETSSPGILVNRLARNAPLIKAAAGLRVGQVLSSAVTLIGAFLIAYIYGWKLALILTVCVPIIIYASYKQQVLLKQYQTRDSKLMDEAGRITSEVVRNIRTVQSLGQEKLFAALYSKNLEMPYKEAKKQAIIYSILYSATQAITFYMYALAFRVGGYFVEIGEMETNNIYKVFFALSLCAVSIGNAFSYIQDYTKARTSVRLLNYLLTRKSEIDSMSPLGIRPDIKGKVQFKNVHFAYPTRSNVKILRGLNLTVDAGKTLALVGESGCGKSTIVSLLERFYDPIQGNIKVDNFDIRTLNISYLRSKIGIVTQEPILFDTSIRNNIAYGAIALNEEVSFEQIIEAAKLANVHDFIMNLPDRYDTEVGERGIQLSGGQKQRVAIARALIRNPKILLLDEATSALDTENEKIVQEALDVAKKGRTCIVVAHRLSTIQNADKICVMQKGKIIEKGTHRELLAMEGHYFQLTQRQVL